MNETIWLLVYVVIGWICVQATTIVYYLCPDILEWIRYKVLRQVRPMRRFGAIDVSFVDEKETA